MKKKNIAIICLCVAVILLVFTIWGVITLLTQFIERSNSVCIGQKFATAEEAIEAMEASEREIHDTSLDYCPPYELLYTFDYEENTIVFYSYCYSFDGTPTSLEYAVRVLKHNHDGTLSFIGGFADFCLSEPGGDEYYYYYTNIKTKAGTKSISFLYLPKDSDKDIYVDGNKAEKILVSIEDREFYICYALSDRDTFLSDIFTPIDKRHHIEIK